jgi:predicted O-methyltransferase YrrM
VHFTELPCLHASPRAEAVAESILPRREGVLGSIGIEEARFLLAAIEQCDARTVVELGVASGGSTLFMLAMLSELPGMRRLFAFDLAKTYYGDESKPVGYLALESEFNVPDRLVIQGGCCVAEVRQALAAAFPDPRGCVDFAFIDGNHRHPWATIDLLFLLPLMREGGVVALHDINLPLLSGAAKGYGPLRLLSRPFPEKFVVSGERPNIGAIRVVDRAKMIDIAIEALAEPWEAQIGLAMMKRLCPEIRNGLLADRAAALSRYFAD